MILLKFIILDFNVVDKFVNQNINKFVKFKDIFKEKILNISNILTGTRFLLLPIFLYYSVKYFKEPENYFIPIILIAIFLFSTDFLDGYLARKWNQITMFGKYFDPLVDLLFIFFTLTLIYYFLNFPLLIYILYILREIGAIYIASIFYFKKNKQALPSPFGKLTTAFGFFLILWYYWEISYPLPLEAIYGSYFFGILIVISFIESFFRFKKDFL